MQTSERPPANGGTVASEERSALIGAPVRLLEPSGPEEKVDSSDATQQILTSLGRFQRELNNALDDAQSGMWADECMNQLIDCVEVALPHGWSDLVEALTDTGRILQTYENARRPEGCLEFLTDAYEMLCLMVGDLIVDRIRPTVMNQWRERYEAAIAKLQQDGLTLVSDHDDAPPPQVVPFKAPADAESNVDESMPFDLPDDSPTPGKPDDEALPTLDELPPLEAILEGADSTTPANAKSDGETPEQSVAARPGPSRLVAEILDQLCEQLNVMESGTPDAAAYAMDRFTGGVRALEREAKDNSHSDAANLCALMLQAARLAKTPDGGFDSGISELGYAFCGVYMEAVQGADESVSASWRSECTAFIEQRERRAAESVEAQAEEAPQLASDVPAASEMTPETDPVEGSAPSADADQPATERSAPAPSESQEAEAPVDETTSAGLLEAAQRAAMKGDAAGAKRYALQAASAIARDEVISATAALDQTKARLKASLESMREARDFVRETEEAVQQLATAVRDGETELGKAREESARIEQTAVDLRAGVAEIERQIAELQERREQELEKVADTEARLEQANMRVHENDEELSERRAAEGAARTDLETRRQTVNDLQRATREIEQEVDDFSAKLNEKQRSHDDITEAIRQICGDPDRAAKDEGLLF